MPIEHRTVPRFVAADSYRKFSIEFFNISVPNAEVKTSDTLHKLHLGFKE
jgi:hypothetical protein